MDFVFLNEKQSWDLQKKCFRKSQVNFPFAIAVESGDQIHLALAGQFLKPVSTAPTKRRS